jgi:hypothetical protein
MIAPSRVRPGPSDAMKMSILPIVARPSKLGRDLLNTGGVCRHDFKICWNLRRSGAWHSVISEEGQPLPILIPCNWRNQIVPTGSEPLYNCGRTSERRASNDLAVGGVPIPVQDIVLDNRAYLLETEYR